MNRENTPAATSRSPLYAPLARQRPLRVIILGPPKLPAWLLDFLDLSIFNDWLEVAVLPVDSAWMVPPAVPIDLRAVLAYERRRRRTDAAFEPTHIRDREGIRLEPTIEQEATTEQIRLRVATFRPDLILLLGQDHLAVELQDVAQAGCWSLDSNLTDGNVAAQALMSPVRRGESATHIGLELVHVGSPPMLLASSWGSTARAGVGVQCHQAFLKMPALLLRALRQLAIGELPARRERTARLRLAPAPGFAGFGAASAALVSTMLHRLVVKWQESFRKLDAPWFVVVRHATTPLDPRDPQMPNMSMLRPPDHCGWADPCIVRDESRHLLFLEQWTRQDAKGVIECVELLAGAQVRQVGRVLDLPIHLSYPQVFKSEGDWHMTVESGQARCVTLYRTTSFPLLWEPEATLLSGWPCTDPTLHFHDGHWYLFVSIAESGSSTCEDLFVFVAKSLNGPFAPHPKNPVVSDVRRARMAGRLFQHESRLIRPSQDCAPSYGAAICFNEVLELSPDVYRERALGRLDGSWSSSTDGCHTYSAIDGIEVLDARCMPWVDPADVEFAWAPRSTTGAGPAREIGERDRNGAMM